MAIFISTLDHDSGEAARHSQFFLRVTFHPLGPLFGGLLYDIGRKLAPHQINIEYE